MIHLGGFFIAAQPLVLLYSLIFIATLLTRLMTLF